MTSDARATLNRAMTEEELLTGVTEALELYGYVWTHSRRSDKALTMGHQGVPDVIAARKGRVVFLELKTEKGQLSGQQWAWWNAIDPANFQLLHERTSFVLVRPSNLDDVLRWLA